MGINSTEVAYSFGQLGSVHGSAATEIHAPIGTVIVAIQFLADNTPTKLVSESTMYTAHTAAANQGVKDIIPEGSATLAAGAAITLTTNHDTVGFDVGWYVFGPTVPRGTKVTEVNVGGDLKEFKVDQPIVHTANDVFFFQNPASDEGVGGQAFTTGGNVKFPKGLTIYGRWTSIIPEADADGGVICYFGK